MPKIKKNLDGVKPLLGQRVVSDSIAPRGGQRQVPTEYRTLKRPGKNRSSCLWLLFLLFLAAVAGFYYWSQRPTTKIDKSLEMTVTGPQEIISGDQASYLVKYKNIDVVTLQKLELSVKWPDGFYFDSADKEAADINATTWNLEDLAPGQEVSLEIKGQLVGNKDELLSALFAMQYQPANFHSDFTVKQSIDTKIIDNKLSLNIEAVDKTMVSTDQEIKVVCKNLTNEAITGLFLDILYPDDLDMASVDPQKNGQYWQIDLQPNEEKSILVKGIFGKDSRRDQQIVAEIGSLVNDKFRRLARAEKNTMVVNPQFNINLTINNRNDNQVVNWGDVLRYQLELTNDSETDLSDVSVTALLDGTALDWNSLETVGRRDGSNIIWTKQENNELSNWPKGATKIFTWQIKVVDKPQAERMIDNIVKINIEGLQGWEQVSPTISLTVGESLTFNNGVYWDLAGRRVGSGILPPQVGVETSYLVVWSLPRATGDFDKVVVETTLPPNVAYVSETDVQEGDLNFNTDTRALTWTINKFSDIILPVTASFQIEIKPVADDEGKVLTLLNATTVTARGLEEVEVRSKALKTSDVIANVQGSVGVVQ
ncbi:MAG: hypothetical protein WC465_01945 [Patescibacteria group bacterium]